LYTTTPKICHSVTRDFGVVINIRAILIACGDRSSWREYAILLPSFLLADITLTQPVKTSATPFL
jgi:hypothetical protein